MTCRRIRLIEPLPTNQAVVDSFVTIVGQHCTIRPQGNDLVVCEYDSEKNRYYYTILFEEGVIDYPALRSELQQIKPWMHFEFGRHA